MNYKVSNREEKLVLILFTILDSIKKNITTIQKILFIYTQEYNDKLLAYVPNNYGPNSFELWDEVSFLKNNGFITAIQGNDDNGVYEVIQKGTDIIKDKGINMKYQRQLNILKQIIEVANNNGAWLVSYVYRWYPKYTEKSLIIKNIIERMNDDRKRDADRIIKLLREKISKSKNN